MVMFDLPVKTKTQRREATRYRLMLLDLGFSQVQLSVYCKYLVNATGLRRLVPLLRKEIPANGHVRVLRLTDEQWATTLRFRGPEQIANSNAPKQLVMFEDDEKNAQDHAQSPTFTDFHDGN